MKTVGGICTFVLFLTFTGLSATGADNVDLKELLSGKRVPLSLELKDLDGTWSRVGLAVQADSTLLSFYARLAGGGSGATTYYTKGETVILAGDTYLLAYRPQTKNLDMAAVLRGGGTPPSPEKLTPSTVLALSLVQLRTVGTIADIRPFNLEQEMSEQESVRSVFDEANDRAFGTRSLNNLKQIGVGVAMYSDDNNQKLPPMDNPQDFRKTLLLGKYISSEKVFVHPKTGEPYMPNAALSGKDWGGPNADKTAVVYETKPAADGTRGVLFLDGHVSRVTESDWRQLKVYSSIP
ncbi:MAG TPA: hypothetical protein VL171_03830 [Verrucomicrobiae bacterium]|nr:hypothetical protein [Verrucomicrobiae bacterium]